MDIEDQQRATLLGKFGGGFITKLPVAHQKRKSSLQEVSSDLQTQIRNIVANSSDIKGNVVRKLPIP